MDQKFPVLQWDLLLEQAIITINMLRATRINPKLSAHDYLLGVFNYNATPMAPPGMKVVAHHKPKKDQHGTSMEKKVFMSDLHSKIINVLKYIFLGRGV